MSTPFGIDFGNFHSVIAVARNRGIDIVVNEVANRTTPSMVSFGVESRAIGEAAKSQEVSNLKNTVKNLKRTLGLAANDPNLPIEKKFSVSQASNVNGLAGSKVKYQGSDHQFNSIQLAAMYFSKIKSITESEIKPGTVSDVAISVPVWYSDAQRRATADAATIAGLNPVRIVNDVTAAAVGYGVFKTDLPEEKPRIVAFVDIGHSDYTVSIGAFKKGLLKVLGTAYDRNLGGRDVDLVIANHFAKQFKTKYKIDVHSNPKAFARVLNEAQKLKKMLSANTQAPFNIESVMNDVDVSGSMTREELEEYLQPLIAKISGPIEQALKIANVSKADVDSIEILGGTTRIPCFKNEISSVFGKPLSFTLNQDEAIAHGTAFICAMHSPTLRVRPFKFEDINPHSVSFFWDPVGDEDSQIEVFPQYSGYPSAKIITLYRSSDFDIEAKYTHPNALKDVNPWIGKWSIKGVSPEDGEPAAVKIKLRQDLNGLYVVDSAWTTKDIQVEEQVEQPAEAQTNDNEDQEPQYRTVTKTVKVADLSVVHAHLGLSEVLRNEFLEKEGQMAASDKLVAETEERKNALEGYIYEIRSKIDDQYASFASEAEKNKLKNKLNAAEEWLFSDAGENAKKAQYIAKYDELAAIGNVIRGRYLSKQEDERQAKYAKSEAANLQKMSEKLNAEKTQDGSKSK